MALPGTSFRLTLAPPDGTLNPIDQIIEEVANQPPPAPKGKQVLWTPALCSKLYEAVRDEKAFMDEVGKGKDKTKTKEYKWKKITASLAEDPAFASFLPLSADQLKKKFVREIDRVSQKYALEKEGSNLSGLTEKDITEPLELMLYGMKIKELKYGREREATKAKDKKRQADMLKHENDVLQGEADAHGGELLEGDENENPQQPRNVRGRFNPANPPTPAGPSSDEELFRNQMQALLTSLQPSKEMLELQLKEKEMDIKAKEAAMENQRAMTQLMLTLINRP